MAIVEFKKVSLMVSRKNKKIDMAEALKGAE